MTKEETINRLREIRNQIDAQLLELGETNEPIRTDFSDIVNLRKTDFRKYMRNDRR